MSALNDSHYNTDPPFWGPWVPISIWIGPQSPMLRACLSDLVKSLGYLPIFYVCVHFGEWKSAILFHFWSSVGDVISSAMVVVHPPESVVGLVSIWSEVQTIYTCIIMLRMRSIAIASGVPNPWRGPRITIIMGTLGPHFHGVPKILWHRYLQKLAWRALY